MIIFLLLVIIAIMLFGAKAVKGAASAIVMGISVAIAALAFLATGWVGVAVVGAIVAMAFAMEQQKHVKRQADREAKIERRLAAGPRATSSNTAEARRLMERNRQLDAAFRAKIGKPD